MHLILASSSPRRADLLRAAGYAFDVVVAAVAEHERNGETPADHVRRLAAEKAAAVHAALTGSVMTVQGFGPESIVLGADTVVVVDGAILGKPRDDRDAAEMLRQLSGRDHEVVTGVSLRSSRRETGSVAVTRVHMDPLSAADIDWYVTNGEGRDKAGAYAIQGLASRFIPRIEGSYANVVGLPISLVRQLLKSFETRYPVR
jgi:septum formation protein